MDFGNYLSWSGSIVLVIIVLYFKLDVGETNAAYTNSLIFFNAHDNLPVNSLGHWWRRRFVVIKISLYLSLFSVFIYNLDLDNSRSTIFNGAAESKVPAFVSTKQMLDPPHSYAVRIAKQCAPCPLGAIYQTLLKPPTLTFVVMREPARTPSRED